MKCKGQGKKEYVVVIKEDDGSKRYVLAPNVTEKSAVFMILGSSLPLDYVAIRHIEELGIKSNKPWNHNAPYNSEFLGAQPARLGEDY
jgi:hypothetical protein